MLVLRVGCRRSDQMNNLVGWRADNPVEEIVNDQITVNDREVFLDLPSMCLKQLQTGFIRLFRRFEPFHHL